MHDDAAVAAPAPDDAPPRLEVRYDRVSQVMRTLAIVFLAVLCALIPFATEGRGADAWLFSALLVALALVWAAFTALRIRDRSPQVVVDSDGIWVREWMTGTVPWENINSIAHSSAVRRSIVSALTRTRRRPYLLFNFVERPQIRPTARPPLSWLQYMRAEAELQEPAIQQRGLDTPVDTILTSIQDHISRWRARHPELIQQDDSVI